MEFTCFPNLYKWWVAFICRQRNQGGSRESQGLNFSRFFRKPQKMCIQKTQKITLDVILLVRFMIKLVIFLKGSKTRNYMYAYFSSACCKCWSFAFVRQESNKTCYSSFKHRYRAKNGVRGAMGSWRFLAPLPFHESAIVEYGVNLVVWWFRITDNLCLWWFRV